MRAESHLPAARGSSADILPTCASVAYAAPGIGAPSLHSLFWAWCALWLVACGPIKGLETLKSWSDAGQYSRIAEYTVDCTPDAEGCNQLHLIQGDACFRLAKQGDAPDTHLACAVRELKLGISQTREWRLAPLDLNRAQTYENLCEALRLSRDNERGQAATALNDELLATAQEFRRSEPDSLSAPYFVNNAAFAGLQPALVRGMDPPALCRSLGALLDDLAGLEERAAQSPYAANYRRLQLDIEGAKRAVPGCP